MDFKRQILEGKDDVVLVRHVKYEGDWEKDYEIHSKFVSSLYGKGRSTFRDNVAIEASKVGAVSDRATFYQDHSKLYLIGHAKAWEYDDDRQKQNEVEGEKILHDLTTGKSQVLGGVGAALKEEKAPANPDAPRRRPRGRVDVKFNEGDEQ
jgi:lipopolysaccharide export system protein LptA